MRPLFYSQMAFLVSFGIMLPHVTLTTYLVDCHRSQSASVTGKYDTNNACVVYQLIVYPFYSMQ